MADKNRIHELQDAGILDRENPDLVALFQQLRNIRESERSIRSLRRSLTLDNIPSLDDEPEGIVELAAAPSASLDRLSDTVLGLKDERDRLKGQVAELVEGVSSLEDTVRRQAAEIARLRTRGA
jgi:methyl-accepting chemotaxis protein